METIIRNVGDINAQDRQALEHVIGQRLEQNQQLVIRVIDRLAAPIVSAVPDGHRDRDAMLPDWCNVYAGLSDEEIAELEKTILARADLTRNIVQFKVEDPGSRAGVTHEIA
jgi:hypothetical protein